MSRKNDEAMSWTETRPELVSDGVYRVPLPLPNDGLRTVNVYALLHADRVTLIDAGWAVDEAFDELERSLGCLGLGMEQIDRMLVTHMHRDHYTLGLRVRRLFGARVEIGLGERESIEKLSAGGADGMRPWLQHWGAESLRAAMDAAPRPVDLPYELPDAWIEAPTEIDVGQRRLRAIPTPGHTAGHIVFADFDGGVLFSGDHVLPKITPSIGFEPVRPELPLGDYLASLRLVQELPDLKLLPAHGAPGMRTHRRVGQLLEHHQARLADTRAAVRDDAVTAMDVAQDLSWTSRDRGFADLDAWSQMLAVAETSAHLDVLVRDRLLVAAQLDGTRIYSNPRSDHAHRDA